MRLLFVTARPLATAGGIQTLVRSLAGALARVPGVEVSVITGAMPDAPTVPLRGPLPDSIQLPFHSRPRPTWLPPDAELVGRECLQGLDAAAAAARPDVLICVSHHSAEAHQAARVAAGLGIPLVLWPLIHTDAPRHVNRTAMGLYRQAAMVVCCSLRRAAVAAEGGRRAPAGADAAPGVRLLGPRNRRSPPAAPLGQEDGSSS